MTTSPLPTTPTQAPWRVFPLPEADRQAAVDALNAIAHALPSPQNKSVGPGLAGGHGGYALFHAYYSASGLDGHDHRGLAMAHLEAAVDMLPYMSGVPGLFAGFTGTAWVVDHLESQGLFEADEDLNEAIDEALLADLSRDPYVGLCEVISGVSGFGLYGLDRGGRGNGRAIAAAAVENLRRTAETRDGLSTWFNAPEALHPIALETHPDGCYNLGLSHGVPGAIGFLAEAAAMGLEGAQPLLEGAVAWLLAQAGESQAGSRFGYSILPGQAPSHGSRLAWCYGDLGIAAVLLLAARRVGRTDWEAEAIELARGCARRPLETAGAMDAALCHGSIGNAHIFHRLWQATGDGELEAAALAWLRHGLAVRRPGEACGGFLAWRAPEIGADPDYEAEPSLLEGSAGIGLALLAFLAPQEPHWDRFLLIHVPPRA